MGFGTAQKAKISKSESRRKRIFGAKILPVCRSGQNKKIGGVPEKSAHRSRLQAVQGALTSMLCSCSECRQNAGKVPIKPRYSADTVPALRHSVQIPRRKNQGGNRQAPPEVCKAVSRWNRPRVCRRCASFRKSIRCASFRRYHLPPLVWYRSGSRLPCIMCRRSGCVAGICHGVPPEQCRQNPRCYLCRCFAGSGSSSRPAGQGGGMQAPAAAGIGSEYRQNPE